VCEILQFYDSIIFNNEVQKMSNYYYYSVEKYKTELFKETKII